MVNTSPVGTPTRTQDFATVTGYPPQSVRQYPEQHRDLFA